MNMLAKGGKESKASEMLDKEMVTKMLENTVKGVLSETISDMMKPTN